MSGTVLVTGASGFVGGHLARTCDEAGDEVVGLSTSGVSPAGRGLTCDLLDAEAVAALIAELQPTVVHHLAALASTGRSWEEPIRCLADNQTMTWNLLEAVKANAPDATVLIACSGESYGKPQCLPIDESHQLAPATPYALAKTASDLTGGLFAEAHGLKVVRARGFNHAGPGQAAEFLIGSLVAQVAGAVRAGQPSVTLRTGTAEIRRDYTDVRDVAVAYRELAAGGHTGIVNVCSGRSSSTEEIVGLVRTAAAEQIEVRHEVDRYLVRPHETTEVIGDPSRVRDLINWSASTPLAQTVADALAFALSS